MFPSTFRRLEVFIAVVDAGSIVAAANRLDIAHPSVSNHIKALEGQVGCQLFKRRRGAPSQLSEEGRRLYDRAKRLLHEIQLLSDDLAPNRPNARQRLTVATQRGLAQYSLRTCIADFIESERHVELVLDIGRFEETIDSLADRKVDVCLIFSLGSVPQHEPEIIGRERFGFFAAPAHPLSRYSPVSIAELARHSFVATRNDGYYGQMVHNLMTSIGIDKQCISHQIQDGAVINEIASRGREVACGLASAAEPFVRNGSLVELRVEAPPLLVDICLLRPSGRRPTPQATRFIEAVRAHLKSTSLRGIDV